MERRDAGDFFTPHRHAFAVRSDSVPFRFQHINFPSGRDVLRDVDVHVFENCIPFIATHEQLL